MSARVTGSRMDPQGWIQSDWVCNLETVPLFAMWLNKVKLFPRDNKPLTHPLIQLFSNFSIS